MSEHICVYRALINACVKVVEPASGALESSLTTLLARTCVNAQECKCNGAVFFDVASKAQMKEGAGSIMCEPGLFGKILLCAPAHVV